MDDTIEKTTAVVTEGRAVVGVLLELMLRPCVLRYYTITPCTRTQTLGFDSDDKKTGNYDHRDVDNGGNKSGIDRWISQYT